MGNAKHDSIICDRLSLDNRTGTTISHRWEDQWDLLRFWRPTEAHRLRIRILDGPLCPLHTRVAGTRLTLTEASQQL